ncbi:unnamed protein product [Rotaria socialis]|uniref:Uncharacterized protein n=2 Tax=Rotaria socialis TaxID=392032 RepID=A0A821MGA8_9BILA|nr:unnamed protein product [Rotaria socialis]
MDKAKPSHENLAVSRYTDLIGEPIACVLSPIKGYEVAPLVSLEQAVAPITNLFDCIEENVWVAKENSKTPPDNLSHEESAAIHLYTMQFDSDPSFYELLNSILRDEYRDNLKPWFTYLKLFLTALHKLPSHPQTVWRGGLCARTQLVSKDTDKEFVLMPGSYFEVVGQLNPADGLYIIQMKELESPFPCVKPPLNVSKPSYTIEDSLVTLVADNSLSLSFKCTLDLIDCSRISTNVKKVRIFSLTFPPQMQEIVIDTMREAIAEGTDQAGIESIVVSALIQQYGGNGWVHITLESTIYTFMARKLFFSAKIDKYNINTLQQ